MKQFIHTYDKAFQIAKEYNSSDELKTTLKYIFEKHYSCYMLCVKDKIPILYKLESKTGDSVLNKQINKTLKQKKIKTTNKTWRQMGCIVKPFKKEPTFAKEWLPFLERVKDKLPNGVFFLSLSDSLMIPNTLERDTVPVFAYSGKRDYKDTPIPNYDDLFDKDIGEVTTEWEQKKSVAVFRGGSTGCGSTAKTNQRLKLATMKSDDLDVGITQYTSHLKFNSPTDIQKIEKVAPVVPKLTWKQQSDYKYILHVDGNVVAYRLLKSMLTKSLILRVKSDFIHWKDNELKPNQHYIEIRSDLSDLQEKLEWCKSHDIECKLIAERAYLFAKKVLQDEYLQDAFAEILTTSTSYRIPNM